MMGRILVQLSLKCLIIIIYIKQSGLFPECKASNNELFHTYIYLIKEGRAISLEILELKCVIFLPTSSPG